MSGQRPDDNWPRKMKALLCKHPPSNVATLYGFLSDFDAYNKKMARDDAFAHNLAGMCNAFSSKFPPGSRPADSVGTPFLWHLLVKLGQYLPFVPEEGCYHDRCQIRKTMIDAWVLLGQCGPTDLEALKAAQPQFLQHKGLSRNNFFPGPLKEICDEQTTMWSKLTSKLTSFLSNGSKERNEDAVEHALTVYVVCDIVGKRLREVPMCFSWNIFLQALQQSLGERFPDFLTEVLSRKKAVLSTFVTPNDAHVLAEQLSSKLDMGASTWYAQNVINKSASAGFVLSYIRHADLQHEEPQHLIKLVQDIQQHPATSTTLHAVLVRIAEIKFHNSFLDLLVQIVLPCTRQPPLPRQLLEQVAMDLPIHFVGESWRKLSEEAGHEEWLPWIFARFCDRVVKSAGHPVVAHRLDASVSLVQQMSAELTKFAFAKPPSLVPLKEFCLAELGAIIQALRLWQADPFPALVCFLVTSVCHLEENATHEIAKLVLGEMQARTKDSSGWKYFWEQVVEGAFAEACQTPLPSWLLRLARDFAGKCSSIIINKERGRTDGLIKELHEPTLAVLIQSNEVVKTIVAVVCMRMISGLLTQVTEAVIEGSYDISASSASLPNLPTLLRVLQATNDIWECALSQDEKGIWEQFKQAVTATLTVNCRAISRIQLALLKQSRCRWAEIAEALGCKAVPRESWETDSFDKTLREVQQAADIAGWLARFNVEGAANHALCLPVGPSEVSLLTITDLVNKQQALTSYLSLIEDNLELINHCRAVHSAIFDVVIDKIFQDIGSQEPICMNVVCQGVRECDCKLRSLLSQQMSLEEAKLIFQQKRVSIGQEVQKLVKFSRYTCFVAGEAQENIENALEILRYSTETPQVVQLIKQYQLLGDLESDSGFLQLQSSQHNLGSCLLVDAPSKFGYLKDLFTAKCQSLTGEHFELFHKLRECPDVIGFFRENNFTTQQGRLRFDQARQRLTVQLQGQDMETKLLNDVINVHELISIFVAKHQSFNHFVEAVLSFPIGRLGSRVLACLDLIQEHVGRVKLWFKSALSSKVESAAVQARMVNESGKVEIALGRLRQKPTVVSVIMEVEGQGTRMGEEEIRELIEQLALSTRPAHKHAVGLAEVEGERARTCMICKQCIKKLQAAVKVFEFACALELYGHPQHQDCKVTLDLSDQHRESLHELLAKAEEYERRLNDWRHMLEEEKRACPFMAAFDPRELLLMHVLLDADPATIREVFQMMSGQALWIDPAVQDADAEARRLAERCLSSFLRSVRGLARQRDAPNLGAALGEKILGNEPRQCLQRLAQFVSGNLQKVHVSRPPASRGGDDRCQLVANIKCGSDFAPIASLLQHIFRNDKAMWSTRCLLWCETTVSEDRISAFMQRIEAFPLHSFVFLGVNRLPPQIQQIVCDFQKRQNEEGPRQGRIVYVYTDVEVAPAADFLAPYPDIPCRSLEELRDSFKQLRHEWAGQVTVICGLPGCGKSTRARALQMAGSDSAFGVAFLDHLDLRRIHAALASLSQKAGAAGTVVRIDISERADWMGVNRALFDLFVFGVWQNLEDGTLFASQRAQQCIVEVPFCVDDPHMATAQENLKTRFPALVACAGAKVEELTESAVPFEVDDKTRFICKFWKASRTTDAHGHVPLDRLCANDTPVKHPNLESDQECSKEFADLVRNLGGLCKRQQQFLQRFLYRRFQFFERSPLYLYNPGAVLSDFGKTRKLEGLGSQMMRQMLREARMLCEPGFVCSAADASCSILVNDQEFALKPCWVDADKQYSALLPLVEEGHREMQGLQEHERCCALLRWRLQLPDGEVDKLSRDFGFVLVQDFVFKLLCIHERREAEIPVIIEGVTGVGKTFVLRFYAHLLNQRLLEKDSDVKEAPRVVRRFKTWLRSTIFPFLINRQRVATWKKELLEEECTVDFMVELWQKILQEPLHLQRTDAAGEAASSAAEGLAGSRVAATEPGDDRTVKQHLLLHEQVALWVRQVPLLKPAASLLDILQQEPLPETSSELLRAFLDTELHDVFYRLLLHPDMTSNQIEAFITKIASTAEKSRGATFVVLLDELNTSSALGLLKAVVVDHKLNGNPLPRNMFFVGCINPHLGSGGRQEYTVHAMPASMNGLRWQYPPLRGEALEHFVTQKILRSPTEAAGQLSPTLTQAFARMICVCQHKFSAILSESSVSQRDVQRCLTIFSFFWKLKLPGYEEAPNQRLQRCIILCVAIVYYFRIADDETYGRMLGSELRRHLDEQLRHHVPSFSGSFREEVDKEISKLICSENFHIPEGIALNRDLRENLFACLVSVQTKVPVCLLGPPGRSKTLAFEVLAQNLLGARSTAEFCRNFCAVDPIVYQCSSGSTGQEIGSVLRRAAEREAGYMRDGGRTRCVVFLDEGGLPSDQRMALKVLHDPLDDGNLPIIVASNRALDAANQGRMLTLARQAQTQEDYELMGHGLLAPSQHHMPQQLRCLVKGLASAYQRLRQRYQQAFTDRDFVSLLRHLRAEAADGNCFCPTQASLLRGLENNFTKPTVDIQSVAEIFFADVNAEFQQDRSGEFLLPRESYRKSLDILEDCIRGGRSTSAGRAASLRSRHPHLAPRFCMILDGGEDDAVVRLLLQEGLLPQGLEVLHVPTVAARKDDDLDLLAVDQMARLQHCMEAGQPVLLRNASRILVPFYNLFNQNYRVTQKDDGEQLLYIIVAHGARTHFCRVHPDFYVVLHMPLAEYDNQPEPLKSRFAQVQITLDQVRELRLVERLPQKCCRSFVQQAFERCHNFVEHVIQKASPSCFAGLQPRQTVESLCLLHLDCFIDTKATGAPPNKISPLCDLSEADIELVETGLVRAVQTVLLHLLQIARPECFLQFLQTLGNQNLYRKAYFHAQHHFSLPALLRTAMLSCKDGSGKLPKLIIQTRTSREVLNLLKLQGVQIDGNNFWDEIGLGVVTDDVHVFDLDEMDSAALVEDKIAAGVEKRLILVGVDMRGRSHMSITWLRDVIDRVGAEHPEVLFVLLLHFPPEAVMSGFGLCPCTFLDHWEFFWLDSPGHRTPFREDLLLQVLCAGKAVQGLPPLIHPDISFKSTTTMFARRALLPLGALPPRIADDADPHVRAAARFYDQHASTEERTMALREVLDHQPAIWQQLIAAFHEGCQVSDLHDELTKLAERIHNGQALMSFMDGALFRLQHRFDSMALAFLAQICSNEGLVGLAADTTGTTVTLLCLLPMPRSAEIASGKNIAIHSQRSRTGLSPLLGMLHHQLSQHLRRSGLVTQSCRSHGTCSLSALEARIGRDPSLREFCERTDNSIIKDYGRFLVQLTCGSSLSSRVKALLLDWTMAGALGDAITVPAALAQLAAVSDLQGGRLRSLSRLCNLLESKFDRADVIPAPIGVLDFEASSSRVQAWRLDVEITASEALVQVTWDALLRCGAPAELATEALNPWEWMGLSLCTEQTLQAVHESSGGGRNTSVLRRRQVMRMFTSFLPALENANKMSLAKSLCARLVGFPETEEGHRWLFNHLNDLLQQEPALLRKTLAMLLFGLLEEESLWSKEAWQQDLFKLMEQRIAGTEDDQEDFLVADELALLLLSKLRTRMVQAGVEQGHNNWPQLKSFLRAQGMRSSYLPRYSPQKRENIVPRVADLLFKVYCFDIVEPGCPSVEVLRRYFFHGQQLFGTDAADQSILACARCHTFAIMLGRWLCSAKDAGGIDQEMLLPAQDMITEAVASILPLHAVPLALEIQTRRGRRFLQDLAHNDSAARAGPAMLQLQELLLTSGLCVHNHNVGDLAAPSIAKFPPLPLCLTAVHNFSPLGDLRPPYKLVCDALVTALQQGGPKVLRQALIEAAEEPLSEGHAKGLFLLAIYHKFYDMCLHHHVQPVLGWLPDLLPNAGREELRFFECLIAPETHQIGYASSQAARNHVNATFALDCRDPMQVAIRHCLVNFLALTFFIPEASRDHFWMHASNPGALHGTYPFGSTRADRVGGVHYDCGCIFDLHGKFSGGPRHWPLRAATASYVHCYGGFCLNYLVDPGMHDALYGHVLTPHCIRSGGAEHFLDMAGDHLRDATAQFCFQRVGTSILYLQEQLGLHPEELCLLLSAVCEVGISKLLAGKSNLKFQYGRAEEKHVAEMEFHEALHDTFSKKDEIFDSLWQNGAEHLKRLCPISLPPNNGSFDAALARHDATPAVQVLHKFSTSRADLQMVSLVPPILRLYWFIHEDLNQHLQGSLTLQAAAENTLQTILDDYVQAAMRTPEQRQYLTDLHQKGVDAFNAFHDKVGGLLVIECGRNEIPIQNITPETSLMLMLSSRQAPESENVLYRVLEYLLKMRQDFLNAVEEAASDSAAPGALRRIPELLGDVPLEHLIHMPMAFEEECRLTVPGFAQRTRATQQQNGGFDVELLLPTLLEACVLGKSRWTLNEVRRDFHLELEQPAALIRDAGIAWEGKEKLAPQACLPAYFSTRPDADARAHMEACLQSLRQAELLELLGVLSRASFFMQRWEESKGLLGFEDCLREAGFELPSHCCEALSSQKIHVEHTGFILQQLQERLQTRAYTFVHLPSRLRRQLPPGASERLDHLFESICEHPAAVDEILAYFSACEDCFLREEARPLVAVLRDATLQPPAHLQGVLPEIPTEVLCRHLFETLSKLLALRLRLAERLCNGDATSELEKWWECVGLPTFALGDGTGVTHPQNDEEVLQPWPELPEKVLAILRGCLVRRHFHLHVPQKNKNVTVEDQMDEAEEAEATHNMFTVSGAEALALQQVENERSEKWAREVLLRMLQSWLHRRRQHNSSKAQLVSEGIQGTLPGTTVHAGVKVKLQGTSCPDDLVTSRDQLRLDAVVRRDASATGPWQVVAAGKETTYRMAGTKLFDKVRKLPGVPPDPIVVCGSGLFEGVCEEDPRAPSCTTLRFVPNEEIVDCDAMGTTVRLHCSARLEALAACSLHQHPDLQSCFVANATLQLQPPSLTLADAPQPVQILDAGSRKCWCATVEGGMHHLAWTASVASLISLLTTTGEPTHPLRVWNPALGVLKEEDQLKDVFCHHEVNEMCLVPAMEIACLSIDCLGTRKNLEVHITATARHVIQLLLPDSGAGTCCLVDKDHRILAAGTVSWKDADKFRTLSISAPLSLSLVGLSGEKTDLRLGCRAGMSDICRLDEVRDVLVEGAAMLWEKGTSRCSLADACVSFPLNSSAPGAPTASLLDLHDEPALSLHDEQHCHHIPTFVMTTAQDLVHFNVEVLWQQEAEPHSIAVVASKDSQLRDLQEQLATLLHLPSQQFELRGVTDKVFGEDESLSSVLECVNAEQMAELAVLQLRKLPTDPSTHIAVQVCSPEGGVCVVEVYRAADAIQIWRLVRWRFDLPPLDFEEEFEFDRDVGVISFTDGITVQELYEAFVEKQCATATTKCTDVGGNGHTFTLEWRV